MYPGRYSREHPDRVAVIMAGSGETVTYAELEERSLRLAQLLHNRGLRPGSHIAVLLENHPRYFEVLWAGLRSGLYVTPINRHLTVREAGYIIGDCGAEALVTSASLAAKLVGLFDDAPGCAVRLVIDNDVDGYERYEKAIADYPAHPLGDEPAGRTMMYSSGTTGRPKGITGPLPGVALRDFTTYVTQLAQDLFDFNEETVYLSPAPLYHSAPIGFTVAAQALGGTVVVMERFDPTDALAAIEAYRVTHSQWVPTMFVRMLKLDEPERQRYDLSSHRVAIHAAAPCPVTIKEQMLTWWGPILYEYYSGSETAGFTLALPEEWLAHPGTVGLPIIGTIHVCGDDGRDLGPKETGLVYFERDRPVFQYHNDPEKTQSAYHPRHDSWATFGDVGHVDEEGFLYLTDRASFMIVAGGVNIYPQEIEDIFILHPSVADVAVIGVPNPDLGEEVKAVVQLAPGQVPGSELAEELLDFASGRLARFKVPRSIDFVDELPRQPTGKLFKRLLRDQYWPATGSKIV
jgi:long-chain acyl-CoA synthetase